MFHTIWSHSRSRHTTTAVLSALSGTTAVATLLASTTTSPLFDDGNNRAVARCEEAAEHDDPPPSDGSKPYRPPQRAGTQFFTQYFAGGGGGEGGRQRHSEAASGIGGGRQEGPADGPSGGGAFVTRVRPKSRPFCPPWDFNWDGRQTEASSPATMATRRGFHASRELGNVRHIILVRHGQYHEEFKDDRRRVLTPLGRHQAELTGQRLAVMLRGGLGMIDPGFAGPCNIKAIHVSDMTRAKETAQIIASHLPGVQQMPPDPLLNEALPADMVPVRPDIDHEAARREIAANQDRIEAAFHKYIHRAEPYDDHEMVEHSHDDEYDDNPHEFEVIVGHGNVIRYFFCRALQLPPEVWLRFSTFNCSITYIMVQPNGLVSVRGMGDFGHMPYDALTFSGLHGLNW